MVRSARLAHAVVKQDASAQITVFLMGDAVLAAKAQQATPDGYYNVERMLKRVLSSNGRVLLCCTCLDARGIGEAELIDGGQRSTMDELAAATGQCRQGSRLLIGAIGCLGQVVLATGDGREDFEIGRL